MAHRRGDAPGGRGGAGRGEAGEGAHELRRPHVGVLGRREAVEVERVGGEPQVARDHHVAEEEREHDSAASSSRRWAPGTSTGQRACSSAASVREFVARVRELQVRLRERMLLDRDVVQARAALRIAPPRLPGGEEVESEAETGLEDDEALAPGPARREGVAAEEYIARLRRPASRAVVDVAVGRGVGRAVAECQARGREGAGCCIAIQYRV